MKAQIVAALQSDLMHLMLGLFSVATFIIGAVIIIKNLHDPSTKVLIAGGAFIGAAWLLAFPTSMQKAIATVAPYLPIKKSDPPAP